MARYTTEYGRLIETGFEPLLDALQSYPIYDENHRAELNEKILLRFKYREIGFETAARFAHYFRALLFEIMPYYNKLYEAQALKYDILKDVDYTDHTEGQGGGESTNDSTSGTRDVYMHSDTPQGGFKSSVIDAGSKWNVTVETDVEPEQKKANGKYNISPEKETDVYMSDASVSTATGASGSKTKSIAQSESERRIYGKMPGRSYPELINEYRKAVWNVDTMILDDLNQCFMGVY